MNPHLEEVLEKFLDKDAITVYTLQELAYDIYSDVDTFSEFTGVDGEEMLDALCLLISWYGIPGEDWEND